MDPEYLHTHRLSPAVDVYSVGVLALILLTARTATAAAHQHGDNDRGIDGTGERHIDGHVDGHADKHTGQHADERATLIHWVASLLPAQNPATFTDPFLLSPSSSSSSSSSPPPNPRSLLRLATLALLCTALPSTSRPSVNRLLFELTEIREELFGAARSEALGRVDREVADMQGGDFLVEMAQAESLASGASVSGGTGASWAVTSVSGGAGVSGGVSGGWSGAVSGGRRVRDELFGAARSEALERVDREVADMQGGDFLAEMARAESLASGASVSRGVSGGAGDTGNSWAVASVSGGAWVSSGWSGGVESGVKRG
ncbi:unnamed protein product [Closterium sp. NIES-64]|nr:unnamed protein product [Closterium sp. NIES-64]